MVRTIGLWFVAGLMGFCLFACTSVPQPGQEAQELVLQQATFADLPGWGQDRQGAAIPALAASCTRILKRDADEPFGPIGGTYGDWQPICARLTPDIVAAMTQDDMAARAFIAAHFQPWVAEGDQGAKTGLFTGYYEASLRGSRTRHGPYQTPLRMRPDDLVMVDLGLFRETLKGQRIAGRVVGGDLKPYEDHRAIDMGVLPGDEKLALVWVDDPVGAFFLQIQGSGRIMLDDGTTMNVGYAGQNGHPYYAIGRELVKRGVMEKDKVSMQSIAAWLKANPDQAREVMYTNPSYVFFRVMEQPGAVGGESVVLSPGRSIAVDRSKIAYGIPVWIDIPQTPPESGLGGAVRQLMVAQDTGGAIRGPIRGDLFFGYGEDAERKAGPLKAQGRWWLFLPRTVMPQ